MDEADFSEDMTYKQQEDLPYDGDLPRSKMHNECNVPSNDAHANVADQTTPQKKAPQETFRNRAMVMAPDKITENHVDKNDDKKKQCLIIPCVAANEGDTSKTNVSNILHHHLSRERSLRGQGIEDKAPQKTWSSDSTEEAAIIENIISGYIQSPCPKEQSPAITDQLDLKRDGESSRKSQRRITAEENACDPGGPDVAGQNHHQENTKLPSKIEGPSDKLQSCQGRAPQKQETEIALLGSCFHYGQGQVLCQFPNFWKVAPKVKMSKANTMDRSLIITKQPIFSPKLRYKPAIMHDILETMSRSNCSEKQHQEQKRKITKVPQVNICVVSSPPAAKMKPTALVRQELLPGTESETKLLKLSSTWQNDRLSSSSSIFQKISQGKQMCQSLKEQTDQLMTKVQEFSNRIKQDSNCHLQDPTEELPSGPSARQDGAEIPPFSSRCAFCRHRLLEWKQKMEKSRHRAMNCGRPAADDCEKVLLRDSALSPSFCPDFYAGPQSTRCEDGSSTQGPKRPPKEFLYRYNSPGQSYLNQSQGSMLLQPRSASPCSKSKWICSQKVNLKSIRDEQAPTPGKKNLQPLSASSPHPASPLRPIQSCKISGSKSLCDLNTTKDTESKILNSALDHALKTASILKKTTDQMIRTIAEDLAKAERWRNRLKY
ncbi:protein AKNAD1 [Ochotona princeps]|uniref:protein AKNAD1 n=1 Tax=Ochotona princeps TaxID=9978 RepID=UPI0027152457|nr:protein AKNAD1 [Ochotona princeps]